jgi:hypothetical protein
MTPEFDKMTRDELRAYVLQNRHDQEAFYKLVDRLQIDSHNQVRHPFPKSLEEVAKIQDLIREKIHKSED